MSSSHLHQALADLVDRVEHFVEDSDDPRRPSDFDQLALAVLRFQARHLTPYTRLWRARGLDPDQVTGWRQAPSVPTSAFRSLELNSGEPAMVFKSSGTSQCEDLRSHHPHSQLELYRKIVDRSFPDAVFGDRDQSLERALFSLIPPLSLAPDSSLAFMTAHVLKQFGNESSGYAFLDNQIEPSLVVDWLARCAGQRPVLLTTALALWTVLEQLEAGGSPPASWPQDLIIMETGGFKTRGHTLDRHRLLARLDSVVGVEPERVVREYGMTELTSQAYSKLGTDGETLSLPPWARVRALDPASLLEVPQTEPGLLAFLDLGNVGSVSAVLTEDVGVLESDGSGRQFRLLGRASGAQLRGCSLLTEELSNPRG